MDNNQTKTSDYHLGDQLSFQAGCNIERYLLEGWSAQESTHRWTDGNSASLQFHILGLETLDITLRVKCYANLAQGGIDHQSIVVTINDCQVTTWMVRQTAWYEAMIPNNLIKAGDLNINFLISNPSAPFDWNLSTDKRKLGLCVLNLEILALNNTREINPDKKYFSVYGNCQLEILARYLSSCPEFAAKYEFLPMSPVYLMTQEKMHESRSTASQLSLIIFQQYGGEFASSEILTHLPQKCDRIKVPSMFFNGYNPEMAYLRQSNQILFYHDRIMLEHINDFDGFKQKLLSESFFPASFSRECVDTSLNELISREQLYEVDVKISDFIADNYKSHRLFHVMNHPSDLLLKEITARVLNLLGMAMNPTKVRVPLGELDKCQFPIYRSHFLNLGMSFDNQPQYVDQGLTLSLDHFFHHRKTEYSTLDLDFAKQDAFAFERPVIRGQEIKFLNASNINEQS